MKATVQFTSEKFKPLPGERDENDPDRFGKALSNWLGDKLAARGMEIDRPDSDDFGGTFAVKCQSEIFSIDCGNVNGDIKTWSCCILRFVGLFDKLFKRKIPVAEFDALKNAIDEILKAEPEISAIAWK